MIEGGGGRQAVDLHMVGAFVRVPWLKQHLIPARFITEQQQVVSADQSAPSIFLNRASATLSALDENSFKAKKAFGSNLASIRRHFAKRWPRCHGAPTRFARAAAAVMRHAQRSPRYRNVPPSSMPA